MKIQAFVAEIFAKQYWCFLIIDFQCIFDISAIMHLWSLQRWIITECLWNFFETRSQNGPISVKWKHQSQLIFCILRFSHTHITFDTLKKHPVWRGWAPQRQLLTFAFILLSYPPRTTVIDLDLVLVLVRKKLQSLISYRNWSIKILNLGSRLGRGPGFSKNWMQLLDLV